MKKFKKYFLFILVLFGTSIISFQPVTDYAKEYLESVFSLNRSFDDDIIIDDLKINHLYIDDIENFIIDNDYYLSISFKNILSTEITSIKINNNIYENDSFTINQKSNNISFLLMDDITFNENLFYNLYIDHIKLDENIYTINYTTRIFKEITDDVIENSKKSVVSVKITDRSGGSSWGSGVILLKEFNVFFNQYDYYVLTNHHVVEDGRIFLIYYQKENGKPSYPINATLIDIADEDTDLALLKFSTFNEISSVFDDSSFIYSEPDDVVSGQPIYTIGSPRGRNVNFNKVSEGVVLRPRIRVILTDSETICQNGCYAIKTNAIILKGSSGGGTFNANGTLIGIHFAGGKNNSFSSSIPMEDILKFVKPHLKNVGLKKEVQNYWTSFFYITL